VRESRNFGIFVWVEHALGQTLTVAQVDENDAAVVARGVHPTDERDRLIDMGFAEFVAMMGTHKENLKVESKKLK
jgi:hypothetical protein